MNNFTKRIPVAAGLAGGSSNAATALIGFNRLWKLGLSQTELIALARQIGSDVPFFLHGGLALGVGRGEEVIPLEDLPPLGVLLVVPPVEVSTPEVFKRLMPGTWKRMADRVYAGIVKSPPVIDWSAAGNDLERVVCEGWPQVAEALEGVRRLGPLFSTVSGSGATVFGIFESFDAAVNAAVGLKGLGRVEVVKMRGRIRAQPEAVLEVENRGESGNF